MTNEFSTLFTQCCADTRIEVLQSASHEIELRDGGGEIRFFVRQDDNGWFTIHKSERGTPERFLFAGSTFDHVERYFWTLFGDDLRARHGMPMLRVPFTTADLPDNITVDAQTTAPRKDRLLLRGRDIAHVETSDDQWLAILYAQYLDHPIALIRDSIMDPEGKPLFGI